MKKLIFSVLMGLLISGSSLAQQSLVGTYKMVSRSQEIQGSPPDNRYGKLPRGSMIITPTRVLVFYAAEVRKAGNSKAEKAQLYDTMNAWSGRYRLAGSRMTVSVEASATENWNGTDIVWNIQRSGNSLTLTSDSRPSGRDPSKTVVTRLAWEKIE